MGEDDTLREVRARARQDALVEMALSQGASIETRTRVENFILQEDSLQVVTDNLFDELRCEEVAPDSQAGAQIRQVCVRCTGVALQDDDELELVLERLGVVIEPTETSVTARIRTGSLVILTNVAGVLKLDGFVEEPVRPEHEITVKDLPIGRYEVLLTTEDGVVLRREAKVFEGAKRKVVFYDELASISASDATGVVSALGLKRGLTRLCETRAEPYVEAKELLVGRLVSLTVTLTGKGPGGDSGCYVGFGRYGAEDSDSLVEGGDRVLAQAPSDLNSGLRIQEIRFDWLREAVDFARYFPRGFYRQYPDLANRYWGTKPRFQVILGRGRKECCQFVAGDCHHGFSSYTWSPLRSVPPRTPVLEIIGRIASIDRTPTASCGDILGGMELTEVEVETFNWVAPQVVLFDTRRADELSRQAVERLFSGEEEPKN